VLAPVTFNVPEDKCRRSAVVAAELNTNKHSVVVNKRTTARERMKVVHAIKHHV